MIAKAYRPVLPCHDPHAFVRVLVQGLMGVPPLNFRRFHRTSDNSPAVSALASPQFGGPTRAVSERLSPRLTRC